MKNCKLGLMLGLVLLAKMSLLAEVTPTAAPEHLKLILCVGQSNMAGRGKLAPTDREVVEGAWKLDAKCKWVSASSPYHFDKRSAGVGIVDEFVRQYLKEHPNEQVGVVPCAVGGTQVALWMRKDDGTLACCLAKTIARIQAAKSAGEFVAILWHQGESDEVRRDRTQLEAKYVEDVANVAAELRKAIGAKVPFVVGEVGKWLAKGPNGGHRGDIVNPLIGKLPKRIEKCALVSSEGLKNQDAFHFTRESQLEFGRRYYSAWQKLAD